MNIIIFIIGMVCGSGLHSMYVIIKRKRQSSAALNSIMGLHRNRKWPGRRGNENVVTTAFDSVTSTPQPLDAFGKEHGISSNVLGQPKRFGYDDIFVRFIDGVLHIWKE